MKIQHIFGAKLFVSGAHMLTGSDYNLRECAPITKTERLNIYTLDRDALIKVLGGLNVQSNSRTGGNRLIYKVKDRLGIHVIPSQWTQEEMRDAIYKADGAIAFGLVKKNKNQLQSILLYKGEYNSKLAMQYAQRIIKRWSMREARDSQKEKHYKFEALVLAPFLDEKGFNFSRVVTKAEAGKVVSQVLNDYGIDTFRYDWRIAEVGKGLLGFAMNVTPDLLATPDYTHVCIVPYNGRFTFHTVLHELAHIVVYHETAFGADPGHGSQFTATFIELIARYTGADAKELLDLYRANKLVVDEGSIWVNGLQPFKKKGLCTRL